MTHAVLDPSSFVLFSRLKTALLILVMYCCTIVYFLLEMCVAFALFDCISFYKKNQFCECSNFVRSYIKTEEY